MPVVLTIIALSVWKPWSLPFPFGISELYGSWTGVQSFTLVPSERPGSIDHILDQSACGWISTRAIRGYIQLGSFLYHVLIEYS